MSAEEQLACQVCLSPYDSQDHRPLLLPACGHTFCAFCVGCLYQQAKRFCPKCRKDGAVQPVSSLPVNYSLLDVAQNNSCGAEAAIEPNTFSPSRIRTNPSSLPAQKFPQYPHRLMQNSSRIPNSNHFISSRPHFQSHMGRAAVNPSVSSYMTFPTPATRTLSACNPNPTLTALETEEQVELDFQMAIHLTFCKDNSHDHDLHSSCSSWQRQNPEDEDLNTILAFMQ